MYHHRPYRTVAQHRRDETAWLAMLWGASQPDPLALPEGYVIRPERDRFALYCQLGGAALGWFVGRYATEAEAITAAHEDDDEQHRTHECDCGAIVTGPGICARCMDRQHDERGDW